MEEKFIVSTPIDKGLGIYNNFICGTQEEAEALAGELKDAEITPERLTSKPD